MFGAGRGIEPHSPLRDQSHQKHHVRPRHKLGGDRLCTAMSHTSSTLSAYL